jgi:hypothetical protein
MPPVMSEDTKEGDLVAITDHPLSLVKYSAMNSTKNYYITANSEPGCAFAQMRTRGVPALKLSQRIRHTVGLPSNRCPFQSAAGRTVVLYANWPRTVVHGQQKMPHRTIRLRYAGSGQSRVR